MTKARFAKFDAALLHALEPILLLAYSNRNHPSIHGLRIERAGESDDDGIRLIATDGRALAICFDPDGRATEDFTAHICSHTFEAATPPKPIIGTYEGEHVPLPLPDWAQPGEVLLFEEFAFVTPKGKHPDDEEDGQEGHFLSNVFSFADNRDSDGYRILTESFPNWRAVQRHFDASTERDPEPCINPKLLDLFSRLTTTTNEYFGSAPGAIIEFGPPNGPMRITGAGVDNFVGFLMPKRKIANKIPDFFSATTEMKTQGKEAPAPSNEESAK